MLLRHVVILVATALALPGCVLQSQTPNFDEAKATPLPKAIGTRFASETFRDSKWQREEGSITFTANGRRYVVSNETDSTKVDAIFVRLGAASWVLQAIEKDKPAAYVLAELEGDNLNVRPLFCEELQKQPDAAETVRFDGSECYLKAETGLDVFRNYARQFGPAKARLVPLK
jgi:hypothetical protein